MACNCVIVNRLHKKLNVYNQLPLQLLLNYLNYQKSQLQIITITYKSAIDYSHLQLQITITKTLVCVCVCVRACVCGMLE